MKTTMNAAGIGLVTIAVTVGLVAPTGSAGTVVQPVDTSYTLNDWVNSDAPCKPDQQLGCFVAMMIDCLWPSPFDCEIVNGEVVCTWVPCA